MSGLNLEREIASNLPTRKSQIMVNTLVKLCDKTQNIKYVNQGYINLSL